MSFIIYAILAAMLIAAFLIFAKKKETRRFGILLVVICVLLEVFVFNFHAFHLVGRDYEEFSIPLEEAKQYGFNNMRTDFVANADGREIRLRFDDVDRPIGTVKFDIDYEEGNLGGKYAPYVDVRIDASDDTNSADFRMNVAQGQLIKDNEGSQYIILALSGNVKDIQFKMTTDDGVAYQIKSITFNSPKPIELSAWRLLAIVAIAFAAYALLRFPSLKESCADRKKLWQGSAIAITGSFCFIALVITVLYNLNNGGHLFTSFKLKSGNQITKELVDAFKAGQVHLLIEPTEELLALENPYDWSVRLAEKTPALWDHLLYDGKYYSYYGIAPVLLLFLPYNLLTGYYFPTPEAVLIFGVVGIVFLSLLYMEIIKRFFPRIPVSFAICSLLILQLCSGIMYCFCSPLFYEIAQASGFAFTMMGLYFLVRSGVIGKGRISRACLVASSFCLATAVLCRPTLALYCVIALIFIGFGFFKNLASACDDGKKPLLSSVGYLASALTCFAVIGAIQMAYNYMRFGSILDFGIQYSLTINDFTRSQYHTDFVAIGFWNYLFAFPSVRPEFPFVFSNFSTLDVNGYYFVANGNAIGLLWRALPMFAYFGAATAYRRLDKKVRRTALAILLPTCIIAPFIIIFSIWESGYGVRYSVDFVVQMIIGALMIIYTLVDTCKQESKPVVKSFVEKFFVIALFVAFVANFALIYDYLGKSGELAVGFLNFERIFEFWR